MSVYTIWGCITEGDEQEISEHGTFDEAMHKCVDLDNTACRTHPDLYYFVSSTKHDNDVRYNADDYYNTHGIDSVTTEEPEVGLCAMGAFTRNMIRKHGSK